MRAWVSLCTLQLVVFAGAVSACDDGQMMTDCGCRGIAEMMVERMAGAWEGELQYLDYQSGQRFGIPMFVQASALPDGNTVFRDIVFTDPDNLVYASSTTRYNVDNVIEAYFRDGDAELFEYVLDRVELLTKDMSEDGRSPWILVMSREGLDDDRPALIRLRHSQTANTQTVVKEVRYLDTVDQATGRQTWIERNRTVLQRVDAVPSAS